MGGFVPPFPANSANLVQALENYVYVNHGHAGEIYVRHLNGLTAQDWDRLRQRYVAIRASMGKYTTSDIAGRVSAYIAAIQLAAEIACPLIGLPFRPETVSAWLAFHLDEQQREQNMIPRVLRMLADHFFANQILFPSQDSSIEGPQIKQDLQGTARMKEYVAFTRSALDVIFKRHRLNTTAILNKLADARVLITTEKDRHTKKVVVGGLQHRMVCIRWAALFPDEFQP